MCGIVHCVRVDKAARSILRRSTSSSAAGSSAAAGWWDRPLGTRAEPAGPEDRFMGLARFAAALRLRRWPLVAAGAATHAAAAYALLHIADAGAAEAALFGVSY